MPGYYRIKWYLLILSAGWCWQLFGQETPYIELRLNDAEKQVDVAVGGTLFTSFLFHEHLKKPVLWPLMSPQGNMLTRSFPMRNKTGDRVDHPHHLGVWLNYGDVNGLDFWNNSSNVASEKKQHYGTIHHRSIEKLQSGLGKASLTATADWKSPDDEVLLAEISRYDFHCDDGLRIIDRTTTLKAMVPEIDFGDSKEGMFAIRVARELELPIDESARLVGPSGSIEEFDHIDNTNVTGNYLSETGIEGKSVWGTRNRWMKLYGEINGEQVAIVILDHPSNPGYPAYWHARGYGLFAANGLAQRAYNSKEEPRNYTLKHGESVTFKYRLIVATGPLSREKIDSLADNFGKR